MRALLPILFLVLSAWAAQAQSVQRNWATTNPNPFAIRGIHSTGATTSAYPWVVTFPLGSGSNDLWVTSNYLWGFTAAVSNQAWAGSNGLNGYTVGVSNNTYVASNHLDGYIVGVSNNVVVASNGLYTVIATNELPRTNVVVYGTLTVTAPTNGVAPPSIVQQPIGSFGIMAMLATNVVTLTSAGTYYVVTNMLSTRTNNFVVSTGAAAGGYLTNIYAGFYRISYYICGFAGNSDTIEFEVNVNGSGKEEIAGFATYDNPARTRVLAGTGILYLPAHSYTSLQLNNRSAGANFTAWRGGITIGTP